MCECVFMSCLSADSYFTPTSRLRLTSLPAHAHTSNLKGHRITRVTLNLRHHYTDVCRKAEHQDACFYGTYREGSCAAAARCGAAGWGRWGAETGSEDGRLRWGAVSLCGEVCHRCRCWDLQRRRGRQRTEKTQAVIVSKCWNEVTVHR